MAEQEPRGVPHEKEKGQAASVGRTKIDEHEATQIRYEAHRDAAAGAVQAVDLRIFKGRREVMTLANLTRDELGQVVGERNAESIEKGVGASARGNTAELTKGKLEKDLLAAEVGNTKGLEAKRDQQVTKAPAAAQTNAGVQMPTLTQEEAAALTTAGGRYDPTLQYSMSRGPFKQNEQDQAQQREQDYRAAAQRDAAWTDARAKSEGAIAHAVHVVDTQLNGRREAVADEVRADEQAKFVAEHGRMPPGITAENEAMAAKTERDIRATQTPARSAQSAETDVENSIEQDVRLDLADEEVRKNVARMWARRDAEQSAADQSAPRPIGGNELDADDAFSDREAIPAGEQQRRYVPKDIESSYLRVGNRYHYTHKPDLQAFEDQGNKLNTRSNSERVVADLVKIANARGWEDIKVKGTDEFRRQVWLEASVIGMKVKGYNPTEADKALLEQRRREHPENSIERDGRENNRPAARTRNDTETKVTHDEPKRDAASARDEPAKLAGVLLEHGAAPYNFAKGERQNYYVRYRDDKGEEKTVWGIDLERAVKESNAEVGQRVELENKGRKAVTVEAPVRDAEGKVVGHEPKQTHRNEWEVKAEALRSKEAKEAVKEHPDLVSAYAVIKAAELIAKERFERQEDRARFVELTRESLARHIEKNQQVPTVKVKERENEQKREPAHELNR